MATYKLIESLVKLLHTSNLSWLLPNLRQDFLVWQALLDPDFFEKFTLHQSGVFPDDADDFSPHRLALLALEQYSALDDRANDHLGSIDPALLQEAARLLTGHTLLATYSNDLASAGLIALGMAENFSSTHTWSGTLTLIRDDPNFPWKTPFACLYGLFDRPQELLRALLQPGAASNRFDLAVHAVLSNPLPANAQLAIFHDLCNGTYGDPLPALDRLALVHAIHEQRPEMAKEFCFHWLELNPSVLLSGKVNGLIDQLNQQAELSFQLEACRIAGVTHDLTSLQTSLNDVSIEGLVEQLNHQLRFQLESGSASKANVYFQQFCDQALAIQAQSTSQAEISNASCGMAGLLAIQDATDLATRILPVPDRILSHNPAELFAYALIHSHAGDIQRANELTDRLIEAVIERTAPGTIPVWGEHFSYANLAAHLISLQRYDDACRMLESAIQVCPSDQRLLKLLADCGKGMHKPEISANAISILVSIDADNLDYHRAYADTLEAIDDWETSLHERSLIVESAAGTGEANHSEDIYSFAQCALYAHRPDLVLRITNNFLVSNPEDARALIYTGKAYLSMKDVENGMQYLLKATQVAPQVAETWLALVEAQKANLPSEVVTQTLVNASHAVPNSAQIRFELGNLYLIQNAPTLALPELEFAARLAANDPGIQFKYGQALYQLGNMELCQQTLSGAYRLEPTYPGLALLYAKILVETGNFEDAISPLENLLDSHECREIEPYLDYARCVLALHAAGNQKVPTMKALIALNEVLQLSPDHEEAKALTAEALAANGDQEMAFQAYREALDTGLIKDAAWLERLSFGFGTVASAVGKHDIAIAALQEAGQANPANPAIYKALTDVYQKACLPEDALRSARTVLIIDGENPDNLSWFARQLSNMIDYTNKENPNSPCEVVESLAAEAVNSMHKAIQLAPTRGDLLIQLGHLQAKTGALEQAHTLFASIAGLDIATRQDLQSAAEYLSSIGDHTSAIRCLEQAIVADQMDKSSEDSSLYVNLAREYVRQNDPASAINILDEGISRHPDNQQIVTKKIDLLLELGQPIEALQCIESAVQQKTTHPLNANLIYLASKINRCIGNFPAAVRMLQWAIMAGGPVASDDFSGLPIQARVLIAETFRALSQPEQAYQVIKDIPSSLSSGKAEVSEFLDLILLQTELAIETGDALNPSIQDVRVDATHPDFPRVMAINSRLMLKAGNYKQAESLYNLATHYPAPSHKSEISLNWSAPYTTALNQVSLIEAALDMGDWNKAIDLSHKLVASSIGECLPLMLRARALIQRAEFYSLCEKVDAGKHQPEADAISHGTYQAIQEDLRQARSIIDTLKAEKGLPSLDLTLEQIHKWQVRADIAFNEQSDTALDPVDVLAVQPSASDAIALIEFLSRMHVKNPESDAVNRMIKIARLYPRNPGVILHIAMAIQGENPADAMKSLKTVLDQNSNSKGPAVTFCHVLLAKIALESNVPLLATESIEAALEFWQDEPSWHILASRIYRSQLNILAAISHLQHASSLSPKDSACQMELGKLYLETANEDQHVIKLAGACFESAHTLEPENVDILLQLAKTQSMQGDLDAAETHSRLSLMLDPNRADIYQLMSEIAIQKNDFQGAYEYANKAFQIDPKDLHSNIMLVRSLSALGRQHEALVKIDAMIASFPQEKQLQLVKVEIISKIDGPKAGLKELVDLTDIYPDDFGILNAMVKIYMEIGEPVNAVDTALHALQTSSELASPNDRANLHLLIGQELRISGQLDQSIEHLTEAISLSPNRLEPYLELGMAQKERRQYAQALQIFEQATLVAPEDPRATFQAGLALKESKDYKSSELMLRRAVNLAPHDINIRRQLAAVVALNLIHNPHTGRG